jgi:glycyl-tRNA synthetase beta subunit
MSIAEGGRQAEEENKKAQGETRRDIQAVQQKVEKLEGDMCLVLESFGRLQDVLKDLEEIKKHEEDKKKNEEQKKQEEQEKLLQTVDSCVSEKMTLIQERLDTYLMEKMSSIGRELETHFEEISAAENNRLSAFKHSLLGLRAVVDHVIREFTANGVP